MPFNNPVERHQYYHQLEQYIKTMSCGLIVDEHNLHLRQAQLADVMSNPQMHQLTKFAWLFALGREVLLITSLLWLRTSSEFETTEENTIVYCNVDHIHRYLYPIDVNNHYWMLSNMPSFISIASNVTAYDLVHYAVANGLRIPGFPHLNDRIRFYNEVGFPHLSELYRMLGTVTEAVPQPGVKQLPAVTPEPKVVTDVSYADNNAESPIDDLQSVSSATMCVDSPVKAINPNSNIINVTPLEDWRKLDQQLIDNTLAYVPISADQYFTHLPVDLPHVFVSIPDLPVLLPKPVKLRLSEAIDTLNAAGFNMVAVELEDSSDLFEPLVKCLSNVKEAKVKPKKDKAQTSDTNKKYLLFAEQIKFPINVCVRLLNSTLHASIRIKLLRKLSTYTDEEFGKYNAVYDFVNLADGIAMCYEESASIKASLQKKYNKFKSRQHKIECPLYSALLYFIDDLEIVGYAAQKYLSNPEFQLTPHGTNTDQSGRNFMHYLLLHQPLQVANNILVMLMLIDREHIFAHAMLMADQNGYTPVMIAENNGADWIVVRELITKMIYSMLEHLAKEDIACMAAHLRQYHDVFGNMRPFSPLSNAYANIDFLKMHQLIKEREVLRAAVKQMLLDTLHNHKTLSQAQKMQYAADIHEVLQQALTCNEYLLEREGTPLYAQLLQRASNERDASVIGLDIAVESEEFILAMSSVSVGDLPVWQTLAGQISDPQISDEALDSTLIEFKRQIVKYEMDANKKHDGELSIMEWAARHRNIKAIKFFHQHLNARFSETSFVFVLDAFAQGNVELLNEIAKLYYSQDIHTDGLYAVAVAHSKLEAARHIETLADMHDRRYALTPDVIALALRAPHGDNSVAFARMLERYQILRRERPELPHLADVVTDHGRDLLYHAAFEPTSPSKFRLLLQHGCKLGRRYGASKCNLPMLILSACYDKKINCPDACEILNFCFAYEESKRILTSDLDPDNATILEYALLCLDSYAHVPESMALIKELILSLLNQGVDLAHVNDQKRNILHVAAACLKNVTAIECLLDIACERLGVKELRAVLNSPDSSGNSVLDYVFMRYCTDDEKFPLAKRLFKDLEASFISCKALFASPVAHVVYKFDHKPSEIHSNVARDKLCKLTEQRGEEQRVVISKSSAPRKSFA